jgi:hypothetical protein
MDNIIEVIDSDEKVFEISEDLQLVFNAGIYHLMNEDDYVIFSGIEDIKKEDDIYTISQEDSTINLTQGEYDLIYDAIIFCKRG